MRDIKKYSWGGLEKHSTFFYFFLFCFFLRRRDGFFPWSSPRSATIMITVGFISGKKKAMLDRVSRGEQEETGALDLLDHRLSGDPIIFALDAKKSVWDP